MSLRLPRVTPVMEVDRDQLLIHQVKSLPITLSSWRHCVKDKQQRKMKPCQVFTHTVSGCCCEALDQRGRLNVPAFLVGLFHMMKGQSLWSQNLSFISGIRDLGEMVWWWICKMELIASLSLDLLIWRERKEITECQVLCTALRSRGSLWKLVGLAELITLRHSFVCS